MYSEGSLSKNAIDLFDVSDYQQLIAVIYTQLSLIIDDVYAWTSL